MSRLTYTILLLTLVASFAWVFMQGIDKHIQIQDTMLCESAYVSRNKEWLEKCACYYQDGDIRCIQKEDR